MACRFRVHTEMGSDRETTVSILDLPAEVRNQIYHDAIVSSTPMIVTSRSPFIQQPALLATCKQIQNEALAMFYTQNIFQSADLHTSIACLNRMSLQTRPMLRSLRTLSDGYLWEIIDVLDTSRPLPRESVQLIKYWFADVLCLELRKMYKQLRHFCSAGGVREDAILLPLPDTQQRGSYTWITGSEIDNYEALVTHGRFVIQRKEAADA